MKKWKCYRKTGKHKIESVFDEKALKVCDINCYLNEESEANAKLISCAPEMIEMLIRVLKINNIAREHISENLFLDIEKLIKKATTI